MASETAEPERTGGPFSVLGRLPIDIEHLQGVATVFPVIVLYFLIAILPVSFAVYASFHDIPLLNPNWTWAGTSNYWEVLEMDQFEASLIRGVYYMVGSTVLQLVVGLWMALTLNRLVSGQKVLTAVVFTAYLVPTVILAFIGLFLFDTFAGAFHVVGSEWLGLWGVNEFALGSARWTLSTPFRDVTGAWAFPLLILIGSWKFSVFITIFALAQLRAIPDRFYEAATVCGANKWQMFRDITLPRIQGVILVAVLLRAIFMFNKFDIIWILTQGGPNFDTTTLPVLAYQVVFHGSGRYGLGNALAVVMFLFLAAGATLYFIAFNPSEEVETTT